MVETRNLIIYFDGVCHLCNSLVNYLIKIDKEKKLKFSPLQSNFAQKELSNSNINPEIMDSIIVQNNGEFYIKSDAIIEIIKELSWFWHIFLVVKIFPKKLRDKLYDIIADRRYNWFGKRDKCMIPTDELKSRFFL